MIFLHNQLGWQFDKSFYMAVNRWRVQYTCTKMARNLRLTNKVGTVIGEW